MHRISLSPLRAALLLGLSALTVVACDDDDDDGGGPSDELVLAKATPSGDAQTGPVSAALPDPLRVLVTENGVPVEGVDVVFAATDGSVDPTLTTTDVDGIASTVWTLGATAGAQAASAAVTDATGSPQNFTATATEDGGAAGMVIVSGDGQAGVAGEDITNPLVIRITDDLGDPVEAAAVDFAVASGDATVVPTNTTTNAAGEAQTVVTLGSEAGAVSVTATSAGVPGSPVTFALESGHFVVSNDIFTPTTISVPVGTTVRWAWTFGAVGHNITPVGGTEPTATPNPLNSFPFTYTHTFNTPGTFNFQCTNHPATMNGTITVTP